MIPRKLIETLDPELVRQHLCALREAIDAAAVRSGRAAGSVELLVASKYYAPATIPALVEGGATLLGENRMDALIEKQQLLADEAGDKPAPTWDFIGELQSRKVHTLIGQVARIHSLASASAVRKLLAAQQVAPERPLPDLLVQVNVAEEPGKGGVAPADLGALLELAADLPVRGLMTMPPFTADAQTSRRCFVELRELAARNGLDQLSMGTSQDGLVAVEEGATVVRLGGVVYDPERLAQLLASVD